MTISDKRTDFFERGVAACNRVFGTGGNYICPICERRFDRGDLERRTLTLEHVPPESAGGRDICLTCHGCNSTAGHQVDHTHAGLARMRAMKAALHGQGDFTGKIRLEAGGVSLNATLRVDESGAKVELPEGQNHPDRFREQIAHWQKQHDQPNADVTFNISASCRFAHEPFVISLLRSAYLAAFAFFGYRYALHERLDIVREQIREPSVLRVPKSAVSLMAQSSVATPDPVIALLSSPIDALAVLFPPNVAHASAVTVILPWLSGPDDFYAALSATYEESTGRRKMDFSANLLGWPTGPALTLDFA